MADDALPSPEAEKPSGGEASGAPAGSPPEAAELRSLHPALKKVWLLGGLLTAAIMAVIVAVFVVPWLAAGLGWGWFSCALAPGTFVILAGVAVVFTPLRYRAWRYALRPHDVLLHYGVLWRTRSCIPRLRIQHVDIESGPIDRAFGMVKLRLYTAGTRSAVASIPGLLPEDAEALREALLQTEPSHG